MTERLMEELDGSKKEDMWKIRALEAEEKLQNIRVITSTVSNDDVEKVTSANKWRHRANTHNESNVVANYGSSEVTPKSESHSEISGVMDEYNQSKPNQTSDNTIPSNDEEIAQCGCRKSENIERQHRQSAEKIQLSTLYSLEKCFINVIHKHLSYKYPDEKHVDNVHLSEVSSVLAYRLLWILLIPTCAC